MFHHLSLKLCPSWIPDVFCDIKLEQGKILVIFFILLRIIKKIRKITQNNMSN